MKTGIFSVIFLFSVGSNLIAQTKINGTVTDSLNIPVPFASVYLSKTTIGTYTDKDGVYSMLISQDGPYEIIASCMGYKSNSQLIYAEGKMLNINIKLHRKIFMLNEITVKATNINRRKYLTQFIKSFIGETTNSQYCKIVNPEELHLYRDSKNDLLKGYSINPLRIENKALGYTILYDLTDFSYNYKTLLLQYSGFAYFQPLTGTLKRNNFWELNRLAAYYGSRMHFMRSLFSNSLSHEGYKIFESKFDSLTNEYSITGSVQLKAVRFLNMRPYTTLLYNDSTLISYQDNHPGLGGEQLVPKDIEKGLFSDLLSRTDYNIVKLNADTLISDFQGIKSTPEKNLKLSSGKNYHTLFYNNPLIISYINNHADIATENPVLRQYEEYLLYTNIQIGLRSDNSKPAPGQSETYSDGYRSTISFLDTLRLYQNGNYYEPYSLKWEGAMANERIADMLPLDFVPDEKGKIKYDSIITRGNLLSPVNIETELSQAAEKVYLHIDRVNYTSGDDIWFKAYVIDPSTNKLSENTNNLHVELIAPDSKIIRGRTVRIENGTGHGDFQLHDSIPSGRYRIRAYTNYMRNYDEQFFFLKEITVVSPYDEVQGLKQTGKEN